MTMTMPSLSRSFQSPDMRHSFLYHAAMILHRAGIGIVQQYNKKRGPCPSPRLDYWLVLPTAFHPSRGVETPFFSKQFIGFMTTNARNWQNRAKLSKTKYFDSLDVVNWPPTHSEFSLGRPMFGCGNWWKFYHDFEKYVAGFAITWFKLVAYNGCKRTNFFHYLYAKGRTMYETWCHEFDWIFELLTRNGCVYKVFKLLLIESCLFLEVFKKIEKIRARLWITSLHIMQIVEQKYIFVNA